MVRYIQQRLLLMIPTILLTSLVVFLMLHLIPGDPASIYLGRTRRRRSAWSRSASSLGSNRPLYVQYADFLLQGGPGRPRAIGSDEPAGHPGDHRPAAEHDHAGGLGDGAWRCCSGSPSACWPACGRTPGWTRVLMLLALAGVSIPVFWLGLLLILLFAVQLGWLPATGEGGWHGLILPAVSLAALSTATLARLVRSSIIEVLNQDFLRTSRAKGCTRSPSCCATPCPTR